MKNLVQCVLTAAALAAGSAAWAQDAGCQAGSAWGTPAECNATPAPNPYGNSGWPPPPAPAPDYRYGNRAYPPAAVPAYPYSREDVRRQRDQAEARRQHDLAASQQRERERLLEQQRQQRQLAQEQRQREILENQQRERERARMGNTRQWDRDGDGVGNRRDRFPDDPGRS